ncbi:beta-N-acetylhexosaminidase [Streptomyces sp. L-9-10]|uniref:beta-N-acetylhexosaminidase n=1 Tax=Streptomyces sp. L-9-10 TaxID=1478131 RepID=UPI001F017296|nr:beta-N-acetylhexosaminidase [Streptomyces sp. L-9-10]
MTALTGALAYAGMPGAAGAPNTRSTAAVLPPVVPQPESERALKGPGFTIGAETPIIVKSSDPDSREVGRYLGRLLRPATGYDLKVEAGRRDHRPAITLDRGGPKSLGEEGYTLTSRAEGVRLTARGAEGLFRGIQTLRQLLPAAVESPTVQRARWTVAPVHITDKPRYGYRSTMLDVARRFYPVADVKRYIDQAAAYKMNTLHLHLTDDQGWRIAIDALPNLTKAGASTQSGFTGGSWFYTKAQYQEIVAYAKSRFITVVPEIDGPGHTSAAQASVPDINCDDKTIPPYSGFDVKISVVCLRDPQHIANVSKFLTTVMTEVAALTPGPYIHVGGDEVPARPAEEYKAYVQAATSAVQAQGKKVIGWHDLSAGTIPAGSLMQYWGDEDARETIGTAEEHKDILLARKGVAQNASFIMSPADRSYLDMKYDSSTPYGLRWAGYVPVKNAYDWDPTTVTAKPDGTSPVVPANQIAGVEAALWADRAYTGSNELPTSTSQFVEPSVYTDFMAFPRLPAVAEIGWSPKSTHDWTRFSSRLAAQGPRWKAAGIGFYAAPDVPWANGS